MAFGLRHALFVLVCAFALGGQVSHAQTPLDHPTTQSAAEDLAEAQFRREFLESRRLLAQRGSEDVHLMVEREGKRARSAIFIFVVVCLILLFVFALPLSEQDKPTANDKPVDAHDRKT